MQPDESEAGREIAPGSELAEDQAALRSGVETDRPGAAAAPRNAASGWFGLESDNTLRGWCRDRSRRGQRLEVAISIDGTPVATTVADRLVRALAEAGEGDGRFGFVYAIPASFFDGREHEARVEIATEGYRGTSLKTRRGSFTIASTATEPKAVLSRISKNGVEGVLTGPPGVREELDVLLDGCRLEAGEVSIEWRFGNRQAFPFTLSLPDQDPLELLGRALVVRYPGANGAETGASLAQLGVPAVSALGGDAYEVVFGPEVALPRHYPLEAEIHAGLSEPALARHQLTFVDNRATFAIDAARGETRLRLRLLSGKGQPIGMDLPFARSRLPRRMLANGTFQRWNADGPEHFALGPNLTAERGFYAFPSELKTQFGLSGSFVAVAVNGPEDQLVLAAQADPFGSDQPIDLGMAIFARASLPIQAGLRLIDGDRTILTWSAAVGTRWKAQKQVVAIPPGRLTAPRVELAATAPGDKPVVLEIAGLHVGDPDLPTLAEPAPAVIAYPAAQPGANLVTNAALTHWPSGLVFHNRATRFEVAEGWALLNPGGTVVSVAAVSAPGREPGCYGLSLSLAAVEQPVRLEIRLEAGDLSGRGEVVFDARLANAIAGASDRWGMIERITLVRRAVRMQDGSAVGRDAVVATVARRVALTRGWERCRFDFVVNPTEEAGFDVPVEHDVTTEYALVFEFHRPVALALAGAEVRLLEAEAPPETVPLAFEDRAIRAQLHVLRGVEGWRSTQVLRPAVRQAVETSARASQWAWKHGFGSVEVAVCVHDAADETLGCLASLARSGGVPHTIRVVDDASGEDTRQRIAAFFVDKPWISLDPNEGHLGYTASANRAVLGSKADWVILLNSDTVVTPGWMEGLLEVAASDPRIALVGPVSNAATYQSVPELYDGTGQWAVNALPPGFAPADMAALVAERSEHAFPEVPLLNGFCTLIRRTAFVEAGGFDERAFPHGYGEENDLCLRLAKEGWGLRVADHVYVHHLKSRSFGAARRAELSRAGDRALRALHPDIDFAALGRTYLANPALHRLRQALANAYPQPATPVETGETA